MLFYLALTKILSLKGYWAHTIRVIHAVVVEVAIRPHIKHVSITVRVNVIRRHHASFTRLTNPIIRL